MSDLTINQVLARLRRKFRLSKEVEHEVLAEIRTHLEDAVANAVARGEDEGVALLKAAEKFGLEEAGIELQEVHEGQDTLEALKVTILPIVLALILRWLAFAPDGSAIGWQALLTRPGFWLVAAIALIVPFFQFQRWRMALLGWAFFWLLTVIFAVYPSVVNG